MTDAFIRDGGEHGTLFAVFAHEQLLDPELAAFPPGETDQKWIGSGSTGESSRLGVEEKPLLRVGDFLRSIWHQQVERAGTRVAWGVLAVNRNQ